MFAYGFEDLTGAEWRLIEALAARGEVHVSLPYEPGRAAFASLSRTVTDLGALAGGDIVELAAGLRDATCRPGSPTSSGTSSTTAPSRCALDSSIRFLEGAGRRATLELVAETVLDLVRDGTAPEEIAIVCPSLERSRASIETAFGALGVPGRDRGAPAARRDGVRAGAALAAPLRVEQRHAPRALRVPPHPVRRARPRGRRLPRGPAAGPGRAARRPHGRGDDEAAHRAPAADARARSLARTTPLAAARAVVRAMLRNAYGLGAPPVTTAAKRDLRAADAATRVVDELERLREAGVAIHADDVLSALDRATVRGDAAGEPGRVAVLDLTRARTRSFEAVFVIGLEQGSLPRRAPTSPFFDDETRRELDGDARRPAAAPRRREPRPLPLLHRLHPAAAAADARAGGGHATTARRARRARSGRPSASSSTRTTCAGTRRGGRSPG